jgi:adenylyltransferase/sulfurtransferase
MKTSDVHSAGRPPASRHPPPPLDREAQARLERSRVLIVGAGGLGSPAALYLAAAGVGTLVLVDFDTVDESNLQRQILYSTSDVGRPKLEAAAERLHGLNPAVHIETVAEALTPANGLRLVGEADVVLDGSDNFPTRYLVNDACVLTRTPNVFGSIRGFEGQASVFAVPGGPCYRCLHPEPPPLGVIPSCAEGGVLGVLPGVVGSIQALEAIKLLAGIGQPLIGRFLLYDARRMRMREIGLPRDPECPVCGDAPSITELIEYEQACAPAGGGISVAELRAWRTSGHPHMLVDVREPGEHAVQSIEGALLVPLGTVDRNLALFARDRPVVVHCRMGARSARAAERLRAAGIDARSLDGGIEAWDGE